MVKKVKQEDLKLGLYLLTQNGGTEFIVGFEEEKAGHFYMYRISNHIID